MQRQSPRYRRRLLWVLTLVEPQGLVRAGAWTKVPHVPQTALLLRMPAVMSLAVPVAVPLRLPKAWGQAPQREPAPLRWQAVRPEAEAMTGSAAARAEWVVEPPWQQEQALQAAGWASSAPQM